MRIYHRVLGLLRSNKDFTFLSIFLFRKVIQIVTRNLKITFESPHRNHLICKLKGCRCFAIDLVLGGKGMREILRNRIARGLVITDMEIPMSKNADLFHFD